VIHLDYRKAFDTVPQKKLFFDAMKLWVVGQLNQLDCKLYGWKDGESRE
jgi:hypothetical protein